MSIEQTWKAHLYIPAYDKTANQASTLSPKIVDGLLKDSLGFTGLVITDALNILTICNLLVTVHCLAGVYADEG